jgi:hypothetical protein
MNFVEHTIDVQGPKVSDGQRSPAAVGHVLTWTERLTRMAVSMAFRYSSKVPGRPPQWLAEASNIRFQDVSGGNGYRRLHFEAPRFGEAAEELYRQGELFETRPAKTDTAFDLIGDIVDDITRQDRDSARFDTGLLKRVERFGGAGQWGVQSLLLHGDRLPLDHPPVINQALVVLAEGLYRETPAPKRARLAGKLDMIRASDGSFALILESNAPVRGVWVGGDPQAMRDFFDKNVILEGRAFFRPSGALLRIEAEGIALASQTDVFFSTPPEAVPQSIGRRTLQKPQTHKTGVAAIFGKWPGDETEEQLLTALRADH